MQRWLISQVISQVDQLCVVKGECSVLKKKKLLWMKTMHYPNTIRSHLVTIVPMASFTPKSISKLRSALHIRYSIIIPRFISRANSGVVVVERLERSLQFLFSRVERRSSSCFTCLLSILLISCRNWHLT